MSPSQMDGYGSRTSTTRSPMAAMATWSSRPRHRQWLGSLEQRLLDSSAYNTTFLHFKAKSSWTAIGDETRIGRASVLAETGAALRSPDGS